LNASPFRKVTEKGAAVPLHDATTEAEYTELQTPSEEAPVHQDIKQNSMHSTERIWVRGERIWHAKCSLG